MYKIKQTDGIIIAGQKGSGKTEWVKKYLNDLTIPFIIYDPNSEYLSDFPNNTYVPQTEEVTEFSNFCKAVWNKGNIIMVVDEAEGVLREHSPLPPYAYQIVRRGRHRGIGLIILTRRPAELNKTVISLSEYVILFRFFLPNDIKYLGQFIGVENAMKLPKLKDYHFLIYNRGMTRSFKPIKII